MMEAMFKKEDIKAGYLLRFWDEKEKRYVNMTVVPAAGKKVHPLVTVLTGVMSSEAGELACSGEGHFWPLCVMDGELTCADGRFRCDEIYGYAPPSLLLGNCTRMRELMWKREEGSGCCRGDGECRCGEDRSVAAEGPGAEATADPFRGECGATESRDESEEKCTCDEPVEAAPVKLTIDEICQRLGYRVQLADEATACGGDGCAE